MKTGITDAFKWSVVLASVFAPFLMLLGARLILPSDVYVGKGQDALDWMWLMMLAAMMLGIYGLTVYVAIDHSKSTR